MLPAGLAGLVATSAGAQTATPPTPGQITPGQITPGQITPGQIAPSQIAPGGNRQAPLPDPARQPADPGPVWSPPPEAAPPGSATIGVTLRDVEIVGSLAGLTRDEDDLRRNVTGRRLSVAAVYAAAARLESAYAQAGYVLVRIAIPPQRIEDNGVLQVTVIDGTIEAIDSDGMSPVIRERVGNLLAPLIGKPGLRLAELERRLTLAGNLAGVSLRSALKAGTRPGTTRLVIDGSFAPVAATLGWDNSLPAALGSNMLTAGVTLNNLLRQGEQITLAAGQTDDLARLGWDASPYAMGGATLELPLGRHGALLTAGYLQARTLQAGSERYLDVLGNFSRSAIGLIVQPLVRRDRNLSLVAGLDRITQRTALPFFALGLSHDAYTSARLAVQGWRRHHDGGSLAAELRWSQGLAGRREPQAGGVPFSQAGASAGYSKLDGRLTWQAVLDRATRLTMTARGQTSFGAPLFLSEKMALAAADAISTTLPGGLDADAGLTLRNELARSFINPGKAAGASLTPYAFGSVGIGWQMRPGQPAKRLAAQAIGVGLRASARLGTSAIGLRVEYGRCFCASAGGSDDNRLSLAVTLGF